MTRPLAGLRVLDLTRLLPGPYLSLVLADMGADVIKVEPPQGGDWLRYVPPRHGGISVQFASLNRGKRSVGLNLKKPGGTDVLKRLVQDADVLLESFRPGVLDRLGVGYEVLKAINPKLIYCAVTGYGQDGPYSQRAGHDLNYCALGGTLAMTGQEGGAPQLAGFQLADIGGGGLFGLTGVLAALYARQTTGLGRFVDVSMAEGALAFNVLALAHSVYGAETPTRGNDRLNGSASCYQVYETSDGRHMSVAPLEAKFWAAFCDAVERPDWKARHMGDDAAMKQEMAALFITRSRDEWEQLFANIDACVEPVLELAELPTHPQHVARGVFFDLKQSDDADPLPQARTPLISQAEAEQITPAPGLGEHSEEVLAEAGFSSEDIQGLVAAGAVGRI
ncbi:MAG: alpha-methylacyl-CoA racemase [Myxococcota bacterium]|jgi:alpha-methylacyl-CoA racemase